MVLTDRCTTDSMTDAELKTRIAAWVASQDVGVSTSDIRRKFALADYSARRIVSEMVSAGMIERPDGAAYRWTAGAQVSQ